MKELKVYMVIQDKDAEVSYGDCSGSYCAGVFLDENDAIDFIKELTNNEACRLSIFGRACNSDGTEWIGTEPTPDSDYGSEVFDIRYRLLELTCGEQEKHDGEYPML